MQQLKHLLSTLLLMTTLCAQAQIGIGTATPEASAQLDVSSTTKGLLPPRMTTTQRDLIGTPATGLIIYNTTISGLQIYSGSTWYTASAATTMGAIGGSSTTNGGTITSGVLSLTPADGSNGGIVTNGTQTFGGDKTFTQSVTANSFVKTGGVSSQYLMADGSTSPRIALGPVGGTSTSNGATLTNGTLSLAPADATNAGIVTIGTQTFAGNKIFNGNVGIGTTTPPAKLSVLAGYSEPSIPGTSSAGVFRIGVNSSEGMDFGKSSTAPYSGWIQNGFGGNLSDPLSLNPLGGNIGIGTMNPLAKLDVAGNIKIVDGTQGAGKVLISDADGLASWQTPSTASTTMGPIGGSSSTNGGTITAGVLSLTPADGGNGGIVTNGTQTFGGDKTFTQSVTANSFVKTGGVSSQYLMADGSTSPRIALGPVGGTSTSNGATLTNGTLSLAPADATNSGIITTGIQTIAGNKTLTGTLGVGTATPAATAQLDVSSSTKGFLPPRMDSTQRNAIASPAAGLTIYNTTLNAVQVYNGTVWSSTAHYIGESYGGGIVFYVYDNGQHGLIAATADQNGGATIRWYGGSNTNTRARGDGIGAGLKNTAIIIANQGPVDGAAFAATVCNEYSVTVAGVTYGDWYLPSKYELNLLYLKKAVVGGFANSYYWSSTELDNSTAAWYQSFGFSSQFNGGKNGAYYVRAVRAF